MNETKRWDLILEPNRAWWDLRLRQVWRYRDLILLFVRRDFVSYYKQTILGPLWFLIQPILTTLTFTVIFGNIASMSTDGLPQFLFYMSGTVIWSYFAECLRKTSDTFISNANIFGKVYFPRLIMPISVLISNLITFVIQFLLFLGFVVYFLIAGSNIQVTWNVLILPLLLFLMAGLGLGFGIIISSLTTKYRDLRFLIQFGVQLWMYATPVIYPVSSIPEKYQWIIQLNPLSPIVEAFRYAFLGTGAFSWASLAYSFGVMVVVFLVGVVIFNRVETTFMDTV
ncbi:MAG: ABC transporter permease [Anaerolineaceae bacterium]|nr:ABC transporter permease [Anaerolineaceae bacterium]